MNSSHIQRKLEQGPRLRALIQGRSKPREMVEELYLTILSRFPTDEELKIMGVSGSSTGKSRRSGVDIAWALINSPEFLYRH